MSQAPDMESLLQELEALFINAVMKAPKTRLRLEKLRHDGYQLALRLECRRAQDSEKAQPDEGEHETLLTVAADDQPQPRFMIDREDFTFLRSIGIDPTRKASSRPTRERD